MAEDWSVILIRLSIPSGNEAKKGFMVTFLYLLAKSHWNPKRVHLQFLYSI